MGMKKDMLQETEAQQLRWRGHVMQTEDCRIVRRVAEWNSQGIRSRGKPDNTGRMGLGAERKDATLRMKNVSIQSSEGEKLCLWRNNPTYSASQ
jgi:hypothetical protein